MTRHSLSHLAPIVIVCGLLCSCTSIVRRPIEDASTKQSEYSRHQPLMTAVVTREADTVTFDSVGGLFDRQSRTLVGFSREGNPVGFTSSDMQSVFVVSNSGSLLELEPSEIILRYRHLPREKIEGLKLTSSNLIDRFAEYGGWIDPSRQIIVNSLDQRGPVQTYPFADIDYVLVRRISKTKTAGLVVGVLATGTAIMGAITYFVSRVTIIE